jgi:hypothetical protein
MISARMDLKATTNSARVNKAKRLKVKNKRQERNEDKTNESQNKATKKKRKNPNVSILQNARIKSLSYLCLGGKLPISLKKEEPRFLKQIYSRVNFQS